MKTALPIGLALPAKMGGDGSIGCGIIKPSKARYLIFSSRRFHASAQILGLINFLSPPSLSRAGCLQCFHNVTSLLFLEQRYEPDCWRQCPSSLVHLISLCGYLRTFFLLPRPRDRTVSWSYLRGNRRASRPTAANFRCSLPCGSESECSRCLSLPDADGIRVL